jgi:hypothetical protein
VEPVGGGEGGAPGTAVAVCIGSSVACHPWGDLEAGGERERDGGGVRRTRGPVLSSS